MTAVPIRKNLVNRTIPPICGAEMASCMVTRCMIPIFFPVSISVRIVNVTTPSPPIWISTRMTVLPKIDHWVAVS